MHFHRPMAAVAALTFSLALTGAAAAAAAPEPAVFAPGVISGPADDADAAFTPDGKTVVFSRSQTILISRLTAKGWSKPQIAPFSGRWNDQQPTMSPDGRFLVFISNRPVTPGAKSHPSGNLWRVERTAKGWGEPVHLPDTVNLDASVWAPSIAGDGSLWFIHRAAAGAPFRLMRSQYRNGAYEPAKPVSFGDLTTQDVDPAVAPDESFIVFGSMHPGPDAHERLFISFRKGDGWSTPIDLGDQVNGPDDTNEARLGPDHKTLFYSSTRRTRPHFPRTPAQAKADLQRADAWDNGSINIWSVSLAPWLDAPR